MSTETKVIIIITLCLSFLINSIMFGWEATRRDANNVAKINQSNPCFENKDTSHKEQLCIDGGGMPNYSNGKFVDCKRNK